MLALNMMNIKCPGPRCDGHGTLGTDYKKLLKLAEAAKLGSVECITCGHTWMPDPADQTGLIATNIRNIMRAVPA